MMCHALPNWRSRGLLCAVLLLVPGASFAADDGAKVDFFERNIRPVLVDRCATCHDGSVHAETALALEGRASLIRGADFGPAIVPGKAQRSLLYRAINGTHKELRMPPDVDDALSREQIAAFEKWIDDGAVWPEGTPISVAMKDESEAAGKTKASTDHWSFQPRKRVRVPQVDDAGWALSDIDRFVWRKLQQRGLQPGPTADKRTLVRRMYFDLIGLPPSPGEMDAALADDSPDALANLVDRLLDSPEYGQRWGRHWLDVARYADTQGDVGDFPIPQAYRYRNWVIDALNADMAYDRFIQLQIAGDLFARQSDDLQEKHDWTVATGFLALARRFGNAKDEDVHLTIEDTIDTIGRGIMGITLRCARCHDHKFDAMGMTDYYGLYGILESTRFPWMGMSNQKAPSQLVPASLASDAQQQADAYWALIDRYEYQINNHFRPWLKPTIAAYGKLKKDREKAKAASQDTTDIDNEIAALLEEHDKFRELLVHGLPWVRKERDRLAKNPPFEMLFAVSEGDAHDARLHRRGDPELLGDRVPRGFVAALGGKPPVDLEEGSGRLALARWITSAEHPLTARVIVNRVWQQHFGQGLVTTASNFGAQGAVPSHPELLDFLANTFVESDGWSLKRLHRRILLSRAYQLASDDIHPNVVADPGNRLIWKYSRRRLEAEAIRDSMLAVSGQLDRSQGGAHPFPAWHTKRYSLNDPFKATYGSTRRSVYLMTQRLFKHPLLGLFDGPDRNATSEQRSSTNVATQALFLMNSSFIQKQAAAFGSRLQRIDGTDERRIAEGYRLAFAREANREEVSDAMKYLTDYRLSASQQGASADEAARAAWASYAKVLLTSNEFFFVD